MLRQRNLKGPLPFGKGPFAGQGFALARISQCAVKRRRSPVGAKPTRQLSLQPVAIGAVMEVTKSPKPSVKRVVKATWQACRP
jgi:hypothetical protein